MEVFDPNSRREQRNFGLVMGGALALIGSVNWGFAWHEGGGIPPLPYAWLAAAALLAGLGLAWPGGLKPLYRAWMTVALAINWAVTRIVLTLIFYGLLVPTALIMRAVSKDPLERNWDTSASSYWQEAEPQPSDEASYRRQF